MNGFLIVDKPSGVTSFSMVSLVRRLANVRRVGHAGTLDPLASGVLPVAVGHATRFIEYLDDALKTYVASVRFGATTMDLTALRPSEVTRQCAAAESISARVVRRSDRADTALFSAIKVAGKPLYRYAREAGSQSPPVYVEAPRCMPAPTVSRDRVRCGRTYIGR
jgi:tRNA pseudouridine55 synthase